MILLFGKTPLSTKGRPSWTPTPGFEPGNPLRESGLAIRRSNRCPTLARVREQKTLYKGYVHLSKGVFAQT